MNRGFSKKNWFNRLVSMVLTVALMITTIGVVSVSNSSKVSAATAVTSMDYYNSEEGPTIKRTGTGAVSFGFVLPKFNGKEPKELNYDNVRDDIQLYVKQENGTSGEWKKIEEVKSFVWNETWGIEHQLSWDGWVCWLKVSETTEFRFHSKSSGVNLDYTLELEKLATYKLTSISTTEETIKADTTGGSATHWGAWTFNGDKNIKYEQIQDDVEILVDNNDGKGFVQFLSNANSGFKWDQNFGYYSDGNGGYWFTNINWSFTLRFKSKSNPDVMQDVKVVYEKPVRTSYALTAYEGTSYDASKVETASVGIPLPKIGGTEAIKDDLDLFKYEVKVDGKWIALTDVATSGWVYEGNGYNKYSLSSQWGYFIDHVYGLWFQPVREDTEIRISYPIDGKKGGDASSNAIIYTIKGNTEYKAQLPADMTDIKVENSSEDYAPAGWKMIFNDEFDGDKLDTNKWSYDEGFLLEEDDINTAGWGNQELEYYTRDNVSVNAGKLNINMKKQSKIFTQKNDSSKKAEAKYSSGKITTKDKFSVKYGRVDFRAKMPTGTGVWPAMWMLPNDSVYGSWPLSGEIDVFEGRGRTPNMVFGTLHYGSQWPNNINSSDAFNMTKNGNVKTGIDDWHVYSVVWDAENIKIYCDGKCYFKCTAGEWYSGSDRGNTYAPFDQRFYLILNLAAGGTFDSGYVPDDNFTSAIMEVDYVRVYQRKVASNEDEQNDKNANVKTDGANDGLYGDYKLGTKIITNPTTEPTTPAATETTPAATETTPAATETTSAPTETTPAPTETTPAATETTPAPTETTTAATETTPAATTKTPVKTTKPQVKKPIVKKTVGKTKVKKATKKRKAKKISILLKKAKNAKKYKVQVSKSKKFKKILVKKTVKKIKFTIKSKKLKNKKKLYVRAKAVGCKTWSKPKKVKIKK